MRSRRWASGCRAACYKCNGLSRWVRAPGKTTNLYEAPELGVLFTFVLDFLLRHRKMPNIDWIRQPELRRGIEEDVSDTLDDRSLFALPDVQDFEEPAVALAQVEDVAERLLNELIDFTWPDNGWIGLTKRTDEQL